MLAVTFDMDGLMFNTEDVYTLAGTELLARRGYTFTPELKDAMMGLPPRRAFEVVIDWHRLDEPWEALAAESDEIFLGLLPRRLTTMPGLLELLAALETAGTPKAIATSSGRRLTDACLTPFQLTPRFSFILTSEHPPGKAGPRDLPAGSRPFRPAARGNARAGRQPERLPCCGRLRSLHRRRARRA